MNTLLKQVLSNSIEVLFEQLRENLFPSESPGGIFDDRLLIIPSSGIQQWIQFRLASSLSISSGFVSTFLNKGVDILLEKLFYTQKKAHLPSQLELFLKIEQEISSALLSNDPLWQPLRVYLEHKEKRKIALALQLTHLFSTYGIYGSRVCQEWEREPKDWQEALWQGVFREWDYPLRSLLSLREKKEVPENLSVHLFAFSHLSPLHFHFFTRVASQVPVYLYHLSPCQEFWSDLHPKEGEGNPLLASMGRVSREMARLLEESDTPSEEGYLFFGGDRQLKRVQRDLLTMEKTQEVFDDDSIQIHVCATKKREIEVLYQNLRTLLAEHQVEPSDILVMAPQITHYAPYIEALFGKEIPYQIADMPIQKNNPLIEGLFFLFALEKERWSLTAVMDLLHHPLFQKKQKITSEEVLQIKKWAQETGVKWGLDGENRASLLKKGHCLSVPEEATATWFEGFGHLIEELARSPESSRTRISFSQGELLGKVLTLLRTLQEEIRNLEEKKSLLNWIACFKKLIENYFAPTEEVNELYLCFNKIERGARHFPHLLYSFALMETLLKESLGHDSATINRNVCQAIRFCSMLPMRTLPAKIICLIGMNHDAFPRKEAYGALDLLKENPAADYAPSRVDFDRQLFLEALLSTREKLLISYLGHDPYDLTDLPPSSVVTELIPYLSKQQIIRHSLHNLDPVRIKPTAPFFIKIETPPPLPKGELLLSVEELGRLSRSSLSHYLSFQEVKIPEEESLSNDEDFILSPLKRAILLKKAALENREKALRLADEKGIFPPSIFGKLAQEQLSEKLAKLPKKKVESLEITGLSLNINPSLTVQFIGSIEGVYEEGLYVTSSDESRNWVKLWPHFLLLNLADPTKNHLLFAPSNSTRKAFFADPRPHLSRLVEFYFYAKHYPLPLIPEWVEPIVKRDLKKMEQAPVYDTLMQWQLQGRASLAYAEWMENLFPLVNQLYGEMIDAWL